MWWKWLERTDEGFVSQAQNPTRREELLRRLLLVRSIWLLFVAIQFIFVLIAARNPSSSISWVVGVMLAIFLSTYGLIDTRIKMIRLISSMQQKSGYSNTPETG